MNLGALFPNLGEPAAPTVAYPSAVSGYGSGGRWIWILIIIVIFFLFKRSGLGGLGVPTPGYGAPTGFGRCDSWGF